MHLVLSPLVTILCARTINRLIKWIFSRKAYLPIWLNIILKGIF